MLQGRAEQQPRWQVPIVWKCALPGLAATTVAAPRHNTRRSAAARLAPCRRRRPLCSSRHRCLCCQVRLQIVQQRIIVGIVIVIIKQLLLRLYGSSGPTDLAASDLIGKSAGRAASSSVAGRQVQDRQMAQCAPAQLRGSRAGACRAAVWGRKRAKQCGCSTPKPASAQPTATQAHRFRRR